MTCLTKYFSRSNKKSPQRLSVLMFKITVRQWEGNFFPTAVSQPMNCRLSIRMLLGYMGGRERKKVKHYFKAKPTRPFKFSSIINSLSVIRSWQRLCNTMVLVWLGTWGHSRTSPSDWVTCHIKPRHVSTYLTDSRNTKSVFLPSSFFFHNTIFPMIILTQHLQL